MKRTEFKTEKEIMEYYRHIIHVYMLPENDAFDIIPHIVMSHGYMEWTMLLYRTFPSLAKKHSKEEFDHFCDVLFKDTELTRLEQDILRRDGWKEYLED